MIKYKIKSKDCLLTVKAKLPSDNCLNERELSFFSRKLLRGFLRPQVLKRNVVAYTGPISVSLYERLQRPIGKSEFFFIIAQIVDSTLKLQKSNLPWNKVVWNPNYSFINEATKEVQLIYLPLNQPREDDQITAFIGNLIYYAKPFDQRDPGFVTRFANFLKTMPGYDPNRIEAYIAQEDCGAISTIKKRTTGGSVFITDKPKDYYEHYERKKAEINDEPVRVSQRDDEATELFNEVDEATELFSEANEATELFNEADEATGLLFESEDTDLLEEDDEATGLLVEDGDRAPANRNIAQKVHFPTLYRVLTGERISVNKPVFRLGKEKSYVDYFVTNNVAVSRSHADIITRGNKYYVRDLNSKNHTYINEMAIPIQIEVEIRNGDRLKLGNEEFVFNI